MNDAYSILVYPDRMGVARPAREHVPREITATPTLFELLTILISRWECSRDGFVGCGIPISAGVRSPLEKVNVEAFPNEFCRLDETDQAGANP